MGGGISVQADGPCHPSVNERFKLSWKVLPARDLQRFSKQALPPTAEMSDLALLGP
jgi:hypothetical protein